MILGSGIALGVVGTLSFGLLFSDDSKEQKAMSDQDVPEQQASGEQPAGVLNIAPEIAETRPVDANGNPAPLWSSEVTAAAAETASPSFSGEVHPALENTDPITLTAFWGSLPDDTMDMNTQEFRQKTWATLKPAEDTRSVDAEVFSAFMPAGDPKVGDLWAVDLERVGRLVNQFHPEPKFRLHNGGPNGAYALLHGESDSHWLINSRVHVEFHLGDFNFYTPAYFEVELLVNRKTKTLEYFRLALPQRHELNVDMNAGDDQVDIQLVKRMDLLSHPDRPNYSEMSWDTLHTEEESWKALSLAFYKFQQIDWLDIDEVVARAKENKKPMNIMMMWGVLDDQSC